MCFCEILINTKGIHKITLHLGCLSLHHVRMLSFITEVVNLNMNLQ